MFSKFAFKVITGNKPYRKQRKSITAIFPKKSCGKSLLFCELDSLCCLALGIRLQKKGNLPSQSSDLLLCPWWQRAMVSAWSRRRGLLPGIVWHWHMRVSFQERKQGNKNCEIRFHSGLWLGLLSSVSYLWSRRKRQLVLFGLKQDEEVGGVQC